MLRDDIQKYLDQIPDVKDQEQLKKFIDQKKVTKNDRQEVLHILCVHLATNSRSMEVIPECLPHFFPIILAMAVPSESSGSSLKTGTSLSHERKCVLLSKLLKAHPDVLGHTLHYFDTHPAPFEGLSENPETSVKRSRLDTSTCIRETFAEPSDREVLEATYRIFQAFPTHFKRKWKWSKIYHYLDHKNIDVRYIVVKCLGLVLEMSEETTNSWLEKLNLNNSSGTSKSALRPGVPAPRLSLEDYDVSEVGECLMDSSSLVSMAGVLLPILKREKSSEALSLVPVPSMELNLRSLSLGVASRKAVCLQGPVGCGKTALVEYLARKTGRGPSDIIKVQLGDQTDSKMLLGTYRCTDIPGEFVWQAGILTQAVMSGKWLLLEDIDSATLDVASVLSSLMETAALSVPGYRDTVYAKSGFQLFLTQRLIPTMTGTSRHSSGASGLLEKHWLCVHVEPLSKEELITVVQTLFPQLSTVATKIVNVFLLCSSGNHEAENDNPLRTTGRLISTRDLIKWCTRAIVDFDVSSPDSALKVLQDAIDVFCCSVPDSALRLELAINICNTLGIVSTRAEYFSNSHKPSVTLTAETFVAGRAKIYRKKAQAVQLDQNRVNFSFTRLSASLLERVTSCVAHKEPVLLVGETGTGKTCSVQFLARSTGHKLIVINMNQQSESADLLGGYKPVDISLLITPIREEFEILFRSFFAMEPNKKFLSHVAGSYRDGKWKTLVTLMAHSAAAAVARLKSGSSRKCSSPGKRAREASRERSTLEQDAELLVRWRRLAVKLEKLKTQVKTEFSLAFAFIEGSLVRALQEGHWVLLDEINLASSETLECLSGLLEGSSGSISLLERGDNESVRRHPDFTMFACMNPATDVGKKELPVGLRNRFTEFYVDELTEKTDLQLLVSSYLYDLNLPSSKVESIVKFYLNVRDKAMQSLNDGTGHKPNFSLRTLCRALTVAAHNPCGNVLRSLYEAFNLSFLTQLDPNSYPVVQGLIAQMILDKGTMKSILATPIPKPKGDSEEYINFEGYWVVRGSLEPERPGNYILTSSVRRNLKDLVRIVSIGKMPVLLQGDTSVGKTSLITYLAKSSGHVCVRINNHEHTDLQEYVGSYVASDSGKLVFKEGVLVEAMRKGYWIILDELNLAPSDVLEALNRVLDDNRELFIPETQQTVKAHSNFMLFATQNPPGVYGGRKLLSRAFRNRFVELHFDEIPPAELQVILHERCHMPESYCKQIINVMTDLQMRRKSTSAFSGKHGFITLRDLFRWGERYRLAGDVGEGFYDWSQHLADEGYLVLAAKVRKPEEAEEIRQVIKKHMNRDVEPMNLFTLSNNTSTVTKAILESLEKEQIDDFSHVIWTYHMRRMAVLVTKSCQFKEPVLLVGETGGGKTTVCQLVAAMLSKHLWSVNCHMHTESSDFLGNLRPVRNHTDNNDKLFEWVDGPLVIAMRAGDIFLADEISLADDSVLERLNSLLEPERSLLIAEKGTDSSIESDKLKSLITAHANFCFIGTMNPGGDYGKKELSPALRNRFTEIWCEGCTNNDDLLAIIKHNLRRRTNVDDLTVARAMIEFLEWLKSSDVGRRFSVSIRDALTWVYFMNAALSLATSEAYYHGACLTYIDSLGSGVTGSESQEKLETFRKNAVIFLNHQIQLNFQTDELSIGGESRKESERFFGVNPFYIAVGPSGKSEDVGFTFTPPTTKANALKVLRALQLKKPVLLEGSPGVGKTSLVSAIAKASGHSLVRINLSDQTDISDLFGADLPLEGGKGGQFAWKDGPFLRALRAGHWILLDELNLASQSVLEGLNACLDHRGEVYIPELGKTFTVGCGTKIFGCQNPLRQGGGRRGLPKSFLNRFIQVFVDPLSDDDLRIIARCQFPRLEEEFIEKIVEFNSMVSSEAGRDWGHNGAPWEMNLRDITRLCELIETYRQRSSLDESLLEAVVLIYSQRFRGLFDRENVGRIFQRIFGGEVSSFWNQRQPLMNVTDEHVFFDNVAVQRTHKAQFEGNNLLVLREQMMILKALAYCVNMQWMPILVGPSGSGKSSVVRVLAQISGQRLRSIVVNSAMDTTEILGGFEQTDYNRHLEQLISDTEDVLIAFITENLGNQPKDTLADLHGQLEIVKGLSNDGSTAAKTQVAEIDIFLQRIEKLLQLISMMKGLQSTGTTDLTRIETKLANLAAVVREDKCLNAGGKFEWVDSVLVKCLRDGTWLLVDQVNLCSPAVLDRLNGLLEPNGVLTIGERGIDQSGNVNTVKPHPNFRLFLTMDPNYGEISRAMRNRGVEIYLLPRGTSHDLNFLDMKSQLQAQGIIQNTHQNALINLNQTIWASQLVRKSGGNQVLQAASLISQQVNRGFPVETAFKTACENVYIKAQNIHDPQTSQRLKQLIGSSIAAQNLRERKPGYLDPSEMTPQTMEFLENARLSLMKQQGTNMKAICTKYDEWQKRHKTKHLLTNFLDESYYPKSKPHETEAPITEDVFLHFVVNFFEHASVEDFHMRYDFLITRHSSILGKHRHLAEKLNDLKKIINTAAEGLVSRSLPWHPLTSPCSFTPDQVQLALKISLMAHIKICLVGPDTSKPQKNDLDQITIEDYSRAHEHLNVFSHNFSVPMMEFAATVKVLSEWIEIYILHAIKNLTYRSCIDLRRHFVRLKRFYDQGKVVLYMRREDPEKETIDKIERTLEMHCRWMVKFVIKTMNESLQVEDEKVHEYLKTLKLTVNKLVGNIEDENTGFQRLSEVIRKNMNFLPPFKSAEIISINDRFQRVLTELTPVANVSGSSLHSRLRLMMIQMKECAELRVSLIKTWRDINISQSPEETSDVISDVEVICTDRKLSLDTNEKISLALEYFLTSRTERELSEAAMKIQLWPIYEYLFLLMTNKLHRLLCEKMINPGRSQMPRELFTNFAGVASIPISLLAVLDTIYVGGRKLEYSLMSELFCQLRSFRDSSLVCRDPEAVLNLSGVSRDDIDFVNLPDYHQTDSNSLLQPTLVILLSSLILNKTDSKKDIAVIKTATLGSCKDKTNQLKMLNEVVWRNSGAINSGEYQFLRNDAQALVGYVTNYLKIIEDIGDETAGKIILSPMNFKLAIGLRYKVEYFQPLMEFRDFLKDSEDRALESYTANELGMKWAQLGVHQIFFFTLLNVIDPVEKIDHKIEFTEECIKDLENMVYSIRFDGMILGDCPETHDPRVMEAQKALDKLYIKRTELLKARGYRAPNAKYMKLSETLRDFRQAFLEPNVILIPLESLCNLLSNSSTMDDQKFMTIVDEAIKRLEGHDRSLQEFSARLRYKFFTNYRDLVQPIQTALAYVHHGMKMVIDESTRLVAERKLSFHFSSSAENFFHNIVRFPTVGHKQENLLQLIDLCTRKSTREFIDSNIEARGLGPGVGMMEIFNTLKNSLSELYNYTSLNGRVTPEIWKVLEKILLKIVLIWQKKEIEGERKKEQEDSLYKHKTQSLGEVPTEEEEINLELHRLFPSHREDDFEGIEGEATLETMNSQAKESRSDGECIFEHLFTDEDIHEVYKIHSKLVQHFVRAPWLKPSDINPKRTYIEPLLERFRTFNTLLPNAQAALSSELSTNLHMSFNILTSVAACNSQGENFLEDFSFNVKPYDFYRSQNIEVVKECLPTLEGILNRVNSLLNQWPEHPTLSSIRTIVIRINSFSIDSPVSRFLTGLELLLIKMREWEENAHSGVSLVEHSTCLIQQIIEWRKLELKCWRSCLETAFERLKAKTSKWWFLLFRVIQSYLNKQETQKSASVENEEITSKKLIERLENFMSQSPLVEFQARLDLLYTFHCHICCVEPGLERDELLAIFWNVHNYYSQFIKEVEARISSLKSPIEKKLKDFVKIARWNDINYWSVKETVEKTHRTLCKFIKEYESGLKQNVAVCLLVKPSNYDLESSRGEWDRPSDRDYTIDPKDFVTRLVPNERALQVQNDLINRSVNLFIKSKGLCEETIAKSNYPSLRSELEQFIEDSMAHAITLKSLDVDRTLPQTKQKSHAKSILQQKKMALADYFKTLTTFGMSYRKGLLVLKNRPDDIIDFTLPPVEVFSAFEYLNQSADSLEKIDQQMLAQWDSCQSYFYKSLIKLNALNSAFRVQTNLGVPDMERCSGFSNHLMLLVNNEKRTLADNFVSFLTLKEYVADLMRVDIGDDDLPLHDEISVCSLSLKDLLLFLRINIEQLGIYIHSCPRGDLTDENEILLLHVHDDRPINHVRKDDDIWRSADSMLKGCEDIVIKEMNNFEKVFTRFSQSLLRTPIHYNSLRICRQSLHKISDIISSFGALFPSDHPVLKTILYMKTRINKWSVCFEKLKLTPNSKFNPEDDRMIDFCNNAEDLMKTVLLVIQNKYKDISTNGDTLNKNAALERREDEKSKLQENGLREKLIESLEKDVINLRLREVNEKLERLLKLNRKLEPLPSQSNIIWQRILPLLSQYLLLSQFYLHEQVALFRTSCKFLYIQLNVFLDLATNGFCVPKDLDFDGAEADEDGEQRDSDKGGMGLTEGEGKKDVSDRLESEDQLEDARPAGEEDESKEDKDCQEEENGIDMSENFDSKLQDLEKPEGEDDDEEKEDDEDLDKEMGDTEEGTEQLDKEIWGDDQEEEEGSEPKESDEQGSGEQLGDKEMSAKDDTTKNSTDEKQNHENCAGDEHKEEINEMNEPDVNDDQINPYHGNQEPLPEPEAMDLPEDLNLDEGEGKEDNGEGEENPFDIDEMKEAMPPSEAESEKPQDEEKKDETGENQDDSGDEESPSTSDPQVKDLENNEENEENSEDGSKQAPDGSKEIDPSPEETEKSPEEQVAPSVDDASKETDATQDQKTDGSHDKVPDKENQNEDQESSMTENNQDGGEDKGTGQAQSEEPEHGHAGISAQTTPVQRQDMQQKQQEKRKNPGESDDKRAIVDNVQPDKKKQRMIQSREDSSRGDDDDEGEESKDGDIDMCKHVKEAERYDNYATDAATEEQAKKQKAADADDPEKNEEEMEVDMHEDEIIEEEKQGATQNPEETPQSEERKDREKSKTSSKGQTVEESQMETQVEVEGEIIGTVSVQRAAESTFYTNLMEESLTRIEEKRREIEGMLSEWKSIPTTKEALAAWNSLCAMTESSARDLSEKLRLVLEPTQASRLKGDYRTGKRINMRKIIPYIASQFRKDKIWMRRTKPSKRDYQIVLALDDSSSMADNHSKELAFESLALISKALGYLEVGELSVLSFGESPKLLHPLGAPFTEDCGSRLIQDMQFNQKNTKIAELVDFTVDMFEQQSKTTDNAKLLIILSDGRGISSDGLNKVVRGVRRAQLKDIFLIFIIVENPNGRDSILDIRNAIFEDGKVVFHPYLDSFPFPFYMILKDINALPGVLSDALRQWFEVVGKIDA
ncbi:midasin isoform X1 [Fopius arisanus]|uniref:Midasin n=1 Tax=Fopius arisanus TaxID=64838 RepID=A0A9R1UBU3_9HYME|nr:PREDICTED: midasin isoform X1 [Fopius arisanus]